MSPKAPTSPKLAATWVEFCRRSENQFTRATPEWISGCLDLDQQLPNPYGWRFSGLDSFRRQTTGVQNPHELNLVFWSDQVRNIEAYAIMTFWRGSELLRSAIRGLNLDEVLPPAILARSLLELASLYLWNANTIEKNLGAIEFSSRTVVTSKDLEERVNKMIWGTRLGDPAPQLQQVNVLTVIDKLSRNPSAAELRPAYDFLCEVAHPNVIGNTRYWSHIQRVNPDGSETRVLSRAAASGHAALILEHVFWSLGWSAGCLRNSFTMFRNALGDFLTKLTGA